MVATALQMDIKIAGINKEILSVALDQAKEGRMHILKKMKEAFHLNVLMFQNLLLV